MIPTLKERAKQVVDDSNQVSTTSNSSSDLFENTFFEKTKDKINEVVEENQNDGIDTGFDYVEEEIKNGTIDNPSPEDHEKETKPENDDPVNQKVNDLIKPLPNMPNVDIDLPSITSGNKSNNSGNQNNGMPDFINQENLLATGLIAVIGYTLFNR